MESLTTTNPFEEFEHFYPTICTGNYAQETYMQEEIPFIVNPNEIGTEMEVYTENCFIPDDVDEKDFDTNFDSMSLSELVTFPEDLKEFGIEISSKEDESLKLIEEENLSFSTLNAIEAAMAVESQSVPPDLFIEDEIGQNIDNIGQNIDYSEVLKLDMDNNQFDNKNGLGINSDKVNNNDNINNNNYTEFDNINDDDNNNDKNDNNKYDNNKYDDDSSDNDIVDVETSSDNFFSSLRNKQTVRSNHKRSTPLEAQPKVCPDKKKMKSKEEKVLKRSMESRRGHSSAESKTEKRKNNKTKMNNPENNVTRNKVTTRNETNNTQTTIGDKNDQTKMKKIPKNTEDLDKKLQETVEVILERRRKNLEWKKNMRKKAQTALEAFQTSKPPENTAPKHDPTLLESPDHSYAKENYLKKQKISKSASYAKSLNFESSNRSAKKMTSILNLSKFNSIKSSDVIKRSNSVLTEMTHEVVTSSQQPNNNNIRFLKSLSSFNLGSYKNTMRDGGGGGRVMKEGGCGGGVVRDRVHGGGKNGGGDGVIAPPQLSPKWSSGSTNDSSNDFERFFRSSPTSPSNHTMMDIPLSPLKLHRGCVVDYKVDGGSLDEGVVENVVVTSDRVVPLLYYMNNNVDLNVVDSDARALFNINPIDATKNTEKLKKKISLSDYRKMSRHNSHNNVERKVVSEADLVCFFDHTATEDHNYSYKPPKFEIVRKNSTQNDLKMHNDDVKIENMMASEREIPQVKSKNDVKIENMVESKKDIPRVICNNKNNTNVNNSMHNIKEESDRVKIEIMSECKMEYFPNNNDDDVINTKFKTRHNSRKTLSQHHTRSPCSTKPQQYRSPNNNMTTKTHHKSPHTTTRQHKSPHTTSQQHRSPHTTTPRYNSPSPSRDSSSRASSTVSVSSFNSRSPSSSSSSCSSCSRSPSRSSSRSYSSDVSFSSASSISVYRNRKRKSRRTSWNRSGKKSSPVRRDEMMSQAGHERRIIYVGCLKSTTSKYDLENMLKVFGRIVNSSVHSKPSGAFYGFVTFEKSSQAAKCKQEGHKVPGCEHYDFGYGGRRQFCGSGYNDLDRDVTIYKQQQRMSHKGTQGMNFDQLLAFHPSFRLNR